MPPEMPYLLNRNRRERPGRNSGKIFGRGCTTRDAMERKSKADWTLELFGLRIGLVSLKSRAHRVPPFSRAENSLEFPGFDKSCVPLAFTICRRRCLHKITRLHTSDGQCARTTISYNDYAIVLLEHRIREDDDEALQAAALFPRHIRHIIDSRGRLSGRH